MRIWNNHRIWIRQIDIMGVNHLGRTIIVYKRIGSVIPIKINEFFADSFAPE